jgi:hypothetical protein
VYVALADRVALGDGVCVGVAVDVLVRLREEEGLMCVEVMVVVSEWRVPVNVFVFDGDSEEDGEKLGELEEVRVSVEVGVVVADVDRELADSWVSDFVLEMEKD